MPCPQLQHGSQGNDILMNALHMPSWQEERLDPLLCTGRCDHDGSVTEANDAGRRQNWRPEECGSCHCCLQLQKRCAPCTLNQMLHISAPVTSDVASGMKASKTSALRLKLMSKVRVLWFRCWKVNSGRQSSLYTGADGCQSGHL